MSGGDHSPNSDGGGCIQIEIIGYTSDCPNWTLAEYDELASILHWLSDNLGIPYTFPFSFAAPVGRLSWSVWSGANGILGHCHAPYNNHSDPTGLAIDLLVPPVEPEPEPPTGDYVTREEWNTFRNEVASILQALAEEIEP